MRHTAWLAYLARRFRSFVASVVVLVTASFLLMQLVPGDPARASLGPMASQHLVTARRHQLGLDKPLWAQYLDFWQGLFTGDLGNSYSLRVPVWQVLETRAPATLELAVVSMALVLLVAIPVGLTAGALTRGTRHRVTEWGFTSLTGLITVIPQFLLGVLLVYVFAVTVHALPIAGKTGISSFVLPVAALAAGPAAGLARIVRTETINISKEDYVRTARAKRMSSVRLYTKHVLPNVLTATLTISGLMLGGMIAGTVLVETIFGWPGLGSAIVKSIREKDFPLIQGIIVFYGAIVLLINLAVDIILLTVDKRSALKEG